MSGFVDQSESRRYLIAIGSPYCPNRNLRELPGVQYDIDKIVQCFTDSSQGYQRVLADQIPLGAISYEIKNELSKWFASPERQASDCVIIYYAGHGDDGYESGLPGEHYLLTVDSRNGNLSNTAISTRSLIESLFQGSNDYPKNVLLILDVCYAGIGQRQASDVLARLKDINSGGSGFWIIASSTDTGAGDGAFVAALEQAMRVEHEQGTEFLAIDYLTDLINQYFLDTKNAQSATTGNTLIQRQAKFIRNPHFVQVERTLIQPQSSNGSSTGIVEPGIFINQINKNDSAMNIEIITTQSAELTSEFKEFFEHAGVKFAHRNRENISFDDLFIFPDLKRLAKSLEEMSVQIQGEKLWDYSSRVLIFGTEQAGKTALAKKLFSYALSNGFLPLFVNGSQIKSSNSKELIDTLIQQTYFSINSEDFFQRSNTVIIIDDLSLSSLNKTAKNKFITQLNSTFTRVILFADESFKLIAPDFFSLDEYEQLEILPFSNVRRGELVEKWLSLDSIEEVDDQQIWAKKDELRLHIDSIVGKNIVPAKPFHILMILQTFEMMTAQRLELTDYGHCYQYLTYQSLQRAHVQPNQFDTYINVLSELAEAILDSSSNCLNESELSTFFERYSSKFLSVNREKVIKDLINSSILEQSDRGLKFRYQYLFYFFASKKLAESLHRGEKAKKVIEQLVDTIHLEKSSNIILFLTHHSKDPWILEEILRCVTRIFPEDEQVTLEADSLSFLQRFVKGIPEIVIETRDARQERLKEDAELDRLEAKYEHQDDNIEGIEEENLSDIVVNVNKLFRSIEVCGQILRSRIGSMERDSLEKIYEESLSVSLRFLSVFLRYSEFVKEESIRKIKTIIARNPKLTNSEIASKVESFYLSMNYIVVLGMLYKAGLSLGSARGRDIYVKVTDSRKDPASLLVQEIIELQFEKKLDINKIEKLHTRFDKNPICNRFLKHIIVRHLYRHDIGFKERQQLADKLRIPIGVQRSLRLSQSESDD